MFKGIVGFLFAMLRFPATATVALALAHAFFATMLSHGADLALNFQAPSRFT